MENRGMYCLLKNLYMKTLKETTKGFTYFNNEKILDIGEEPEPEYELSELNIDYESKAYAVHGFSAVVNLSEYVFRGLNIKQSLDTYSRSELKKIVLAGLYEVLMNGITLPVIAGGNVELVIDVLREHQIKAVILLKEEEVPNYEGLHYVYITRDNKLEYKDSMIGALNNICSIDRAEDTCLMLDISSNPTYNISNILYSVVANKKITLSKAIDLLVRPYMILGIDSGYIDRNGKPDIIVYDLREPVLTTPPSHIEYVLLRGYPPSQVFIDGDIFFDHGESLVISKPRIDFVLEK